MKPEKKPRREFEERPEPTSTLNIHGEQDSKTTVEILSDATLFLLFALIAIPLVAASLRLGIFIIHFGR